MKMRIPIISTFEIRQFVIVLVLSVVKFLNVAASSKPPITDSPWFWVLLFSAVGLILMLVFSGQISKRQARLDRQYQARERVQDEAVGDPARREYSSPENTLIPIWPLAVGPGCGPCSSRRRCSGAIIRGGRMNYLAENALPIWVAGAVLLTMAGVVYWQLRSGAALAAMIADCRDHRRCSLGVEHFVETPREAVERTLYEMADVVEANDVAGALTYRRAGRDRKFAATSKR